MCAWGGGGVTAPLTLCTTRTLQQAGQPHSLQAECW